MRVFLDGGARVAFLNKDNEFVFDDVEAGTHLIEVASPTHFYPSVRITVSATASTARLANFLAHPNRGPEVALPLLIRPIVDIKYFKEREVRPGGN